MAELSTVTLLFTDVVGSTELHDRLGDDAVDGPRRRHFALLSDAVRAARGREIKRMGDGISAVFSSAVEAVGCAVAIQRSIATAGANDEDQLAVRVGLNAGEVTEEEGYYGLRAGYWAIDHDSGLRLSIMAWDDAAAIAAAMPAVATAIKKTRDAAGRAEPQRSPDSTARYEVIAIV